MTTMEQQRNLKIVQQFHLLDNINTEFNVYEEGGNEVYKIAGKTNSYDTSKSLAMTDASGKVLAYIDQSTMQGQAERITGQTTLHILSLTRIQFSQQLVQRTILRFHLFRRNSLLLLKTKLMMLVVEECHMTLRWRRMGNPVQSLPRSGSIIR